MSWSRPRPAPVQPSPVQRPPEGELRVQLVRFCQLLHQKNYLAANDGNVSVRLGGGRLLMTPSGVPKGLLAPEDLVVVDEQGMLISGTRRPSGELAMHLNALRLRPDVESVVHAHPPTCIALSLHRHLRLNGVLPEVILSIGRLEVVPYARPLSEALAQSITGYIEKADALILERHGTLTVGASLEEAYARTERLEHAALVLMTAHTLGRPAALPEHEVRALTGIYEKSRNKD